MDGKTETLCVYGNPIAHSKSPLMHNELFKVLGINAVYVPFAPSKENFSTAIQAFRALNFRGANITIPYKSDVVSLVDELSPISAFTNSVNTLYWKDGIVGGVLCGTTTDPYGCIRNLEEHGVKTTGENIALLGNGGAAKAIAYALADAKNSLTIVCRNFEKGRALAESLNAVLKSEKVHFLTFEDYKKVAQNFTLVINATPVGMEPHIDDAPLEKEFIFSHQSICDIIYNPRETKLLQFAKEKGAKVITGEGMLVHQGAESFVKWFPKETAGISREELTRIMREGLKQV